MSLLRISVRRALCSAPSQLAALTLLLVASCAQPTPPGLPVVKVDEAHYKAVQSGSAEPLTYLLAPGEGFVLDAAEYVFVIPAEVDVPGPNMIQLVRDDDAVYTHPWDMAQVRYTLTPDTLLAVEGGTEFPGLEAGHSYLVGVGNADSAGRFVVLWVGIVEVQAP